MSGFFSIVTSTRPQTVGKTYSLGRKGKLEKTTIVSIAAGRATTVEATPENIVAALRQTTESTNQVILLDSFVGAAPGSPAEIDIVIEDELARLIGGRIAKDPGVGFYTVKGRPVTARLERLMTSSAWILVDADSPEGMPGAWARLSLARPCSRAIGSARLGVPIAAAFTHARQGHQPRASYVGRRSRLGRFAQCVAQAMARSCRP